MESQEKFSLETLIQGSVGLLINLAIECSLEYTLDMFIHGVKSESDMSLWLSIDNPHLAAGEWMR